MNNTLLFCCSVRFERVKITILLILYNILLFI